VRAALAVLLLAAACASGPQVRVESDATAPFSTYRTFAFQSPLGTDGGSPEHAVSRYLKAATRRELEARGIRYDEAAPDLRVNFNARLSETGPSTAGAGSYYSYRHGYYSAWSAYPSLEAPQTVGTVNIDIVDVKRRQLVWEAIVTGAVTDKTLTDLQPAVDRAVTAAFARFPGTGPGK
jgi:hypothetical protein